MSNADIKSSQADISAFAGDSSDVSGAATAIRVWANISEQLRKELEPQVYAQFIACISAVGLDNGELHLGVADELFAELLAGGAMGALIEKHLPAEEGVTSFIITGGYDMPEEPVDITGDTVPVQEDTDNGKSPASDLQLPWLLASYSFDNFVVGDENRYAYSAVRAVVEKPGIHNPLFIYGASGTGKTHLVVAAAHAFKTCYPSFNVRYASCEEVLNQYVDSLRNQNSYEFRSYMRDVDVLIIDDVHQLAGKTQLQEQFFNTFNALYAQNKQIILTCDRQPSEVKGLEPRLVSRFESGVTMEIFAPGVETRLAILEVVQAEQAMTVPADVLTFIATNITANVRRLKGALYRLVACASAGHRTIDLPYAEEVLHRLIEEERVAKVVSIEDIIKEVAQHFELHVSEILGDRRPKNIAEPRMVAMYLSRKLTNHSFPEIGAAFGKNHATIMNAMKKVPDLCRTREAMRRSVEMIERQLKK